MNWRGCGRKLAYPTVNEQKIVEVALRRLPTSLSNSFVHISHEVKVCRQTNVDISVSYSGVMTLVLQLDIA